MTDEHHALHRLHTPDSPFFGKAAKQVALLSSVFSVSHISLFRMRPGYHTVRLSLVIPAALFLLFWNPVLNLILNYYIAGAVNWIGMGFFRVRHVYLPPAPLLQWLALAMLVSAWVKRKLAWRALFQNRGWNTYSLGKSYLCLLLPWVRPDWINRIVEPLICGAVGYHFYQSDNMATGIWLMLSAVSVWWTEQAYLEYVLASKFAQHNSATLAVMQQELITGIQTSMKWRTRLMGRLSSLGTLLSPACARVTAFAQREVPDFRSMFEAWMKPRKPGNAP